MKLLPRTRSCFACGESNPLGLHLRFQTDGQVVQTEFVPLPEHIGFKHTIHGGLVATVLDEAMAWACAVQAKQFGFCAELNVRFQQPLRPGERTIVIGELISNRRNRIFEAKAQLRTSAGVTLATATGKYLPIKPADAAEFMTDLVGDLSSFAPLSPKCP